MKDDEKDENDAMPVDTSHVADNTAVNDSLQAAATDSEDRNNADVVESVQPATAEKVKQQRVECINSSFAV